MTRDALLRELRKTAKIAKLEFEITKSKGKGSHYRIRIGERFTTIKSGELTPAYVRLIKKQLGVN